MKIIGNPEPVIRKSIVLDYSLFKRLDSEAKRLQRPLSWVVRVAINGGFDALSKMPNPDKPLCCQQGGCASCERGCK